MESNLYKETKYLRFMIVDRKPKTVVMHVENQRGQILGEISWFGRWRQYTFEPESYTTFNKACLQDITDVLTRLNEEHRRRKSCQSKPKS